MNIIHIDSQRENFTTIAYKEHITVEHSKKYEALRDRITNAFNQIEFLTVVDGTRDAHLLFINPDEVEQKKEDASKYGLVVVLLNREVIRGEYANHTFPYQDGEPFVWRAVITRPNLVQKWENIWKTRTSDVIAGESLIGLGLGYPECCVKFFCDVWVDKHGSDTTWQQAVCTTYGFPDARTEGTAILLSSETPIWGNNLLRWLGVKLITHLPCSFNCDHTKAIALQNLGLATKYGFGAEYHLICKMLEWEITWTAQYGVATIETPDFVVQTLTDITTEKYMVKKLGSTSSLINMI